MSVSQVLVILLRRGWIVVLALLTTMIVAGGVLLFVPRPLRRGRDGEHRPRQRRSCFRDVDRRRLDHADARQHNCACHQPAGRGRRREAIELDRQSAGPGEFPRIRPPSGVKASTSGWLPSLVKSVDPKFNMGTNVLSIKYKSGDPNQAALLANAFLAATIDGSVAMKAAAADQTARWFAPQLEELRKDVESARAALEAFQAKTNMVAPTDGGDSETSQYMAIAAKLSAARAAAHRAAEPTDERLHRAVERSVGSRSSDSRGFEGEAVDLRSGD